MIQSIFFELGAWNWMVLGFVLLGFELVLPGVFLLWIGIAALLTGALSLQLGSLGFFGWQWQLLVFLALSVVAVLVGRRLLGAPDTPSDQPLLNRRAEQLIGQTAVLLEPLADGRSRVRLGDTIWRVAGPDLAAGTRVRVVAVRDTELVVADAG